MNSNGDIDSTTNVNFQPLTKPRKQTYASFHMCTDILYRSVLTNDQSTDAGSNKLCC